MKWQYFKICKLWQLIQKEVDNMNRPLFIREIKYVVKNLHTKQ